MNLKPVIIYPCQHCICIRTPTKSIRNENVRKFPQPNQYISIHLTRQRNDHEKNGECVLHTVHPLWKVSLASSCIRWKSTVLRNYADSNGKIVQHAKFIDLIESSQCLPHSQKKNNKKTLKKIITQIENRHQRCRHLPSIHLSNVFNTIATNTTFDTKQSDEKILINKQKHIRVLPFFVLAT